ncbi:hypothetical protein C3B57_14980 [Clostridioides difficile]
MNDDNFNKDVGKKLFKVRKDLKLTRAELGKKINLHETTIKRYEDGDIKKLDIDKLKEFAKALDVSPSYLMGWDEKLDTFKISKEVLFYDYLKKIGVEIICVSEGYVILKTKNAEYELEVNDLEDLQNTTDFFIKFKISELINKRRKFPNKSTFNIDTIAAHNEYLHEEGEIEKIYQDLDDMDNW